MEMEKRWILKQSGDKKAIDKVSQELKIDKILADLLCQRGITSYEEAEAFFRPQLNQLHNPLLMKDMDKAVFRIDEAIKSGEKILIYGDYDVDGTTAVALVYSYFSSFYENIGFYIPNRDTEGYGVSYEGIDYASENNFKLIICLDCGIKAVEQIAYAKEKGIDFIVADHHLPGEHLPDAFAVLDPKRNDCEYPYKELSGCGIGFKLAEAYAGEKEKGVENLGMCLDLVAVSIAADIVPITGENRVLAFYGLHLLNTQPRPGIEAILKYSNVLPYKQTYQASLGSPQKHYFARELSISDLVFMVGPRINAAGRIENGENSVKLLLAKTLTEADVIARQINSYNIERKHLDSTATADAKKMISGNVAFHSKKSIVVYNEKWHKGIVGIVASRLVEEYYKPTIVFTSSNNSIVGSARSIKDFDIYAAIESCSEHLEHFGGHKYAAGLSVKPGNLEKFIAAFEQKVEEFIDVDSMTPEVEIDAEISLSDITPKFIRILKQFAPFGPGNMVPVFKTGHLIDTGLSRIVGTDHLKISVIHVDQRSEFFSGIGFHLGEHLPQIKAGKPFSLCYQIEENQWNGRNETQLNIKDIRF